ncbi:CUB domain family protein [Acanthocheilonema viteae]|uniref:CUB domain-containing protein n=1 Tax=Acanthocheilonema viteae TaxID=6277 RepID=A0A498SK69_ACAVI|nr:unnamed protein product [Acanthocheilonema viteae]
MPVTISSPNYPNSFNIGDQCIWLLKALPGGFVNFQFIEQFQLQCEDTCDKSYVEVKTGPDFRITGYRFCCSKAPRHIFQSATNEMLVIFRGFGDTGNGFKAQVWSNIDDETVISVVPTEMTAIPEKTLELTIPTVENVTIATTTTATTVTAFTYERKLRKEGNISITSGATTIIPITTDIMIIANMTTTPAVIGSVTEDYKQYRTPPSLPIGIQNFCECGEWTEWTGPCTQECGGCGKRLRTRQCSSNTECRTEEKRACAFNVCPYGTNFLINNGEFHILWKGCCVGLFRSGDSCSALDDSENPFLKLLETLLSVQDMQKNRNLPDSKKQ